MQNSSTHPVRLEQLPDEKLKQYAMGCGAAFLLFLFIGSESGPTYEDTRAFPGNSSIVNSATDIRVDWQTSFTGMRTSYDHFTLRAHFVQPCNMPEDGNSCDIPPSDHDVDRVVSVRGLDDDSKLAEWRALSKEQKKLQFPNFGEPVGDSCKGVDSGACQSIVEFKCQENTRKCGWITLLNMAQVRYSNYIVLAELDVVQLETQKQKLFTAIEFEVVHGTPSETWYLGLFKYAWVAAACLAHRRYKEEVGRLRAQSRSEEQLLLTHVVFALTLFNDPLYFFEKSLGGVLLPIIAVMGEVTYWTLLLLFWAVAVDRTRLEAEDKRFERKVFYADKVKVAGLFWFSTVFLFCDNLREARSNPVPGTGLPGFMVSIFQLVAVATVVGYAIWIGGIVWALYDQRELQALSQRFQFLLLVSGITCLVACFGAIMCGYFGVMSTNMGEYTGFYSLFNIYTLFLAFLYSPAPGNTHVVLPEPSSSPSPLPSQRQQREIEMANSVSSPSPALAANVKVGGSSDFGTDAEGEDPFGNPRLARGASTGGPVSTASQVAAADKSAISMGDIEHSFTIGEELDSDGEMEGDTEIEL